MSKRQSRTARIAPRYRQMTNVKELPPELIEAKQREKDAREQVWMRRATDFIRHVVEQAETTLARVAEEEKDWPSKYPPAPPGAKGRMQAQAAWARTDARRAVVKLCVAAKGKMLEADTTLAQLKSAGANVESDLVKRMTLTRRALNAKINQQQGEIRRAIVGNASVVRLK